VGGVENRDGGRGGGRGRLGKGRGSYLFLLRLGSVEGTYVENQDTGRAN